MDDDLALLQGIVDGTDLGAEGSGGDAQGCGNFFAKDRLVMADQVEKNRFLTICQHKRFASILIHANKDKPKSQYFFRTKRKKEEWLFERGPRILNADTEHQLAK